MKANELMIGDWVVKPSGHILPMGRAEFANGDDWFEDIKPIPLTAEILEKNGFERRGGVSYHKSITGLIIPHWNDDLCFLNYSKKNIPPIMIPFHYVHELQRALRSCELWELADNFKI